MAQRPQMVIAKTARGSEKTLALLRQDGVTAFVCAEDSYDSIVSGSRMPPMAGYPIEFVRWADSGKPLAKAARHGKCGE